MSAIGLKEFTRYPNQFITDTTLLQLIRQIAIQWVAPEERSNRDYQDRLKYQRGDREVVISQEIMMRAIGKGAAADVVKLYKENPDAVPLDRQRKAKQEIDSAQSTIGKKFRKFAEITGFDLRVRSGNYGTATIYRWPLRHEWEQGFEHAKMYAANLESLAKKGVSQTALTFESIPTPIKKNLKGATSVHTATPPQAEDIDALQEPEVPAIVEEFLRQQQEAGNPQ